MHINAVYVYMCDPFRFSPPYLYTEIDMRGFYKWVCEMCERSAFNWASWLISLFDATIRYWNRCFFCAFICLEFDRFFPFDILLFFLRLRFRSNFYDGKEKYIPSSIQLSAKWSEKEMIFMSLNYALIGCVLCLRINDMIWVTTTTAIIWSWSYVEVLRMLRSSNLHLTTHIWQQFIFLV